MAILNHLNLIVVSDLHLEKLNVQNISIDSKIINVLKTLHANVQILILAISSQIQK
jgi:hypothetical protein